MTPDPIGRAANAAGVAQHDTNGDNERRTGDGGSGTARPHALRQRRHDVADGTASGRWRRSSTRERPRQLGPTEYALIALIVLGIAITMLMAILNP